MALLRGVGEILGAEIKSSWPLDDWCTWWQGVAGQDRDSKDLPFPRAQLLITAAPISAVEKKRPVDDLPSVISPQSLALRATLASAYASGRFPRHLMRRMFERAEIAVRCARAQGCAAASCRLDPTTWWHLPQTREAKVLHALQGIIRADWTGLHLRLRTSISPSCRKSTSFCVPHDSRGIVRADANLMLWHVPIGGPPRILLYADALRQLWASLESGELPVPIERFAVILLAYATTCAEGFLGVPWESLAECCEVSEGPSPSWKGVGNALEAFVATALSHA
ncbi:hypothetical protein HDU87_003804 [Geranomyces variabilis]|uniref:Uncharacterized protein n=1 Tax=Geranomyces variabilis TaxID=109894 RepID=A0AAD5TLI4_9FUNG|nr:hypothetical protein HDU87_003804 [Geranomyces variabilis]